MTPSPFSRPASGAVSGLLTGLAQAISGVKTFAALIIASAGIQVSSLFATNGTGASDVGVKVGVSTADGSVNAAAKLLSVRTGIGGTEVEKFWFTKTAFYFAQNNWNLLADGNGMWFYVGTTPYVLIAVGTGVLTSGYGIQVNSVFGATVAFRALASGFGRVDLMGTDSSGTPGAATIDKGTGKSAIAAGASSVVITNSTVTAASRIIITPQTRDATCKELIAVPTAGSFTVSGSANATAALIFSWQVSNIL